MSNSHNVLAKDCPEDSVDSVISALDIGLETLGRLPAAHEDDSAEEYRESIIRWVGSIADIVGNCQTALVITYEQMIKEKKS